MNISWSTVLGDILHQLVPLGQLRKQIHSDYGLTGSGTALHNDRPLFIVFLALQGCLQDLFIYDLLLIDHDEFPVACQHGSDRILQAPGWSDLSVLNLVEHLPVIAMDNCLLDEIAQHRKLSFGIYRSLHIVRFILPGIDRIIFVPDIIVHADARVQADLIVLNRCVVITDQLRIGP